jgi:IS1 family transposase
VVIYKVWLISAYPRESGKIVAYVWGKRDIRTAEKLRKWIKQLEALFLS